MDRAGMHYNLCMPLSFSPSFLSHLECSVCGNHFDAARLQTFCPACQAPLLAQYDLPAARQTLDRDQIQRAPRGMWRWSGLLPLRDPACLVSLGEGDTPTLSLPRLGNMLGLSHLDLKDESANPTGSFKARGLAAAVSLALELGAPRLIIPTAGNAGGAMAAYAARAGLPACVYMPADTPRANIEECRIAGAEVVLVDGLISDAARLAAERARAEGWFDLSTFKEPYRLEGKKVMGYEIAEQSTWQLPDVIVYPTGGGTGLVGIWRAFNQLEALGWLDSPARPRMVAVQAEGCAPVVRAFEDGADRCGFWEGARTYASGLRVPKPFADHLILQVLRESGGAAVSVSDEAIRAAQARLAGCEGIFAAPEGAATLAGLELLLARGLVRKEERILLLNTGSGLKYL
jgi:threonine synthase